MKEAPVHPFTPREIQTLRSIQLGASTYSQLAERLGCAVPTAKGLVDKINLKLPPADHPPLIRVIRWALHQPTFPAE